MTEEKKDLFQCFSPFRGTENVKISFWYWVWHINSNPSGKQGQETRKAIQDLKSASMGKILVPLCSVPNYQQFPLGSTTPGFHKGLWWERTKMHVGFQQDEDLTKYCSRIDLINSLKIDRAKQYDWKHSNCWNKIFCYFIAVFSTASWENESTFSIKSLFHDKKLCTQKFNKPDNSFPWF